MRKNWQIGQIDCKDSQRRLCYPPPNNCPSGGTSSWKVSQPTDTNTLICSYQPSTLSADDYFSLEDTFGKFNPNSISSTNISLEKIAQDVGSRDPTFFSKLSDDQKQFFSEQCKFISTTQNARDLCNYSFSNCDCGPVASYCSDYKNFSDSVCIDWASSQINYINKKLNAKLVDNITKYCDSVDYNPFSETNSATLNKICGCIGGTKYVNNYEASLRKDKIIDPGLFEQRECFLPSCNGAVTMQENPSCPALNILSCTNNITVDSNGNIKSVEVKQSDECKQIIQTSSCSSNDDCPPGQSCTNGTCSPGTSACKTDTDCKENKVCKEAKCIMPTEQCRLDSDCNQGYFCINGQCKTKAGGNCKTNSDCPSGKICINENCSVENLPSNKISKNFLWLSVIFFISVILACIFLLIPFNFKLV